VRGGGVLVKADGEDGLGAAGVLDGLGGKEEVFGWGCCVGAVLGGCGGCGGGGFTEPFEEEDYAVDGAILLVFKFAERSVANRA